MPEKKSRRKPHLSRFYCAPNVLTASLAREPEAQYPRSRMRLPELDIGGDVPLISP